MEYTCSRKVSQRNHSLFFSLEVLQRKASISKILNHIVLLSSHKIPLVVLPVTQRFSLIFQILVVQKENKCCINGSNSSIINIMQIRSVHRVYFAKILLFVIKRFWFIHIKMDYKFVGLWLLSWVKRYTQCSLKYYDLDPSSGFI